MAENKISLDIELMRKLEEEGIEEKIIYTSSNDNNLYIELLDKDIYLIHKKNLEKKYRKLEYEVVSEPEKIKLIPTRYITAYTNK